MVTSVGQIPKAEMLLSIEGMAPNLGEGNVSREKGSLLTLVYKFGQEARWCCYLPPK